MFVVYEKLPNVLLLSFFVGLVLVAPQSKANDLDERGDHMLDESVWLLYSTAKAKWMWFDVYSASLFTLTDSEFSPAKLLKDRYPLKLQLCYERSLTAKQIIEASNKGLPDKITALHQEAVEQLHHSYQNVERGDCYSLIHTESGFTQLSLNNNLVFQTQLPRFKELYFGIWLGDNPLSNDVKDQLLKTGLE